MSRNQDFRVPPWWSSGKSVALCLLTVYGWFCVTRTELGNFERGLGAHKAQGICYLTLCWKSLPFCLHPCQSFPHTPMRQHFLKLHSACVGYTLALDPSSAPILVLAPQHGNIFGAPDSPGCFFTVMACVSLICFIPNILKQKYSTL